MPERTLFKNLDSFIDKRTNEAYLKRMSNLPEYEAVSDKESRLITDLRALLCGIDKGDELLDEMEDTISQLSGIYAKYAFIQGFRDAMEIVGWMGGVASGTID